ncbi:hypothetical protein PPERSA_09076 [Pseudocohnilembus persalinus]|uniref:Uncharacterized protein n=1 Tax=Pseudocohnilembus persalinus TaxID=266149 RepID=A0A0V0Q7B0_PSEPJ|nr:hypothetical protein PPERSA_09076 [Pseudocohnilembus persalinus]|eukprot:KRW98136.1 hypothetical protein PPERSA_09076 [Pseudocohnilembus persalinus]
MSEMVLITDINPQTIQVQTFQNKNLEKQQDYQKCSKIEEEAEQQIGEKLKIQYYFLQKSKDDQEAEIKKKRGVLFTVPFQPHIKKINKIIKFSNNIFITLSEDKIIKFYEILNHFKQLIENQQLEQIKSQDMLAEVYKIENQIINSFQLNHSEFSIVTENVN